MSDVGRGWVGRWACNISRSPRVPSLWTLIVCPFPTITYVPKKKGGSNPPPKLRLNLLTVLVRRPPLPKRKGEEDEEGRRCKKAWAPGTRQQQPTRAAPASRKRRFLLRQLAGGMVGLVGDAGEGGPLACVVGGGRRVLASPVFLALRYAQGRERVLL